ncbi:hypothetical protein T03_6629 [Trichinella britovi]|uniref:Uncharacterized protein n=1 Tax=Trichinella britovi TaxID=45882 RepID=A0A0V1C9H5_TRIBR|nr:hypothetical protein T03_6629 [Trichinella britovi]
MAERVRHDDKDTTSDCSRKVLIAELESIVCAADLTELLNYYISDELQMVLCDVEAPINDCPLTLIFSGTQDKLALTAAQGSSRSVALFTYSFLLYYNNSVVLVLRKKKLNNLIDIKEGGAVHIDAAQH